MASVNKATPPIFTHEGAKASHITPYQQLRRSVMACMLWESEFYENGETIAKRIADLVPQVDTVSVGAVAIEARDRMHLRHAPLLVIKEMAKHPKHKALVASLLTGGIQRADELSEFVSIYWKDGKKPLSAQVKRGLAQAFKKFSEYQLAKYNRDKAVKLRDVLRLCHPKPDNEVQSALWKRLLNDELKTPDTWEVALSAGADKKETWVRLLTEEKLGGLALLRNLRNMESVGVPPELIRAAIGTMKTDRVLPFRYIAAARHAKQFEPVLETTMFRSALTLPRLMGDTVVLVDVSGSMDDKLSAKSDMTRLDAGCGLAMLLREVADNLRVFTFSQGLVEVPPRRGFALRDAITTAQPHGVTYLGLAVNALNQHVKPQRLIVITDEQSSDPVPNPFGSGYIINVASAKNGVGYGAWNKIDGWSEAVLSYLGEMER